MKTKGHPRLIVGAVLILTLVMGFFASSIVMDNDVKIYFPHDHESYIRTKQLDKTYGSQVLLDVCISTDEESILTAGNLETIGSLIDEFEKIEFVTSVDAITNMDYPVGTSDGMQVSPLVDEDFEPTAEGLADLKARLLDWPDAYSRTLYSDDFKATQIIIRIDDEIHSEEMGVVYDKVLEVIGPYDQKPLTVVVSGDPVLSQVGKQYMYTDLAFLIPFVVVVLFLCLFFSFRKLSATIMPLLTVIVATVWTIGTMALFGVSFTVISSCLPVLIIAVGSAYGIHVINHYHHVKKTWNPEDGDALKVALKEVRVPIFLAGFTTLVGFLSIISSPVVPMKAFGAFAGLGTVYSLVLSLVFIPALIRISEKRNRIEAGSDMEDVDEVRESRLLSFLTGLTHEHRAQTIIILAAVMGLSAAALFNLNIESSLISYFPYDSQIRKDSRYISDKFAGTNTFNVVFEAEEGKNLTDPAALKAMDDLKQQLMTNFPDEVGHIISFSDFIKRMNQIMNYPAESASTVDSDVIDDGFSADSFFAGESESVSFFGGEDASTDSFFDEGGAGSFFDDSASDSYFADAGSDSFFDGDAAPAAGEVSAEYLSLDKTLSYADLMVLLRQSLVEAGSTQISVSDLTEEIMKQTNYRGMAYYEIPWDVEKYPVADRKELQNLISQYLLLYSGSLDEYANDPLEPTQARMFVQIRSHDTSDVDEIISYIDEYAAQYVPEGYSVYNAGIAELELALTDMITSSQITSLLLALAAVLIILTVTYRSVVAGIIGIIPLSFSIIVNFGLMSILGINLDMVTALIASIAIGIGVDYTVHFLARYKLERAKSDDLMQVTRNTVLSTGRGIVINAVSVGLGFAVLVFSRFIVLRYIGLLVAVIMLTSSLGALTILPLLLNTIKPRFMEPRGEGNGETNKRKQSA